MELMPILSTLRRHKTAAGLIVLEVALTCAIVCNALHLIQQRVERIQAESGLAESELVTLYLSGIGKADNVDEITSQDLQALRALPGVKSATIINQVTFGNSSTVSGMRQQPEPNGEGIAVPQYASDEHALATMGLKLVEGRNFRAEEIVLDNAFNGPGENPPRPRQVIISQALAKRLFPGSSALGKQVYVFGDVPIEVIGVVQTLGEVHPGPQAQGPNETGGAGRYGMLLPLRNSYRGGFYVMRVDPAQRDAVLKAATPVLESIGGKRMVREARTLEEMRSSYYAQDRAMIWLLGGVCVALLLVTALGIVGLASFWVQQRTRMIGTRRALGATRGQILRYFQLENLLLSSAGIALGMGAAYGINLALIRSYELPLLPAYYLPVGALALCLLGQLAVLGPARRAAALPPVAALRF
ncbi:ABC transporter permease [Paucibacter aquatile]|uniref:ABC transporter permease n=1 Tax=Kinneretia aquatilis TaxID=2070761 RepID=A0A2N8KV13_9BURK|nr:FtsX-like permease family protein [Paucibacter aquatile]PND37304.1 ABC transporter permease [Paucibacter aquatile]